MAEDGSDRGSTSKGNGGLSSMDSMESHRWVFQDEENSEIDYEDNGDDDGDDFTLQNDMDSEDEDSLYQKLIRTGPRIDSFGVEALEVPGAHRSEYEDASLGKSIFLVFQTLGVVFGDVGTSPLYTFSVMFSRAPIETNADIIGALSLVLYTLILIPLIKYILIVLLANDDGEGGTFALYSLICRHAKISLLPNQLTSDTRISSFRLKVPSAELERSLKIKEHLENSLTMKKLVLVLVLAGTSMVIADGVVTPAMSVISAVRGLKVAFPAVEQDHVVMISVAYLIILFSVQKYGTSKVGLVIGPALFIWFCSLGGIGIYNLVKHDSSVVKAFNPIHIYYYFKRNPTKAWYSLGGCLLCATGSEAMFADLCYFPVRTIQITFVFLVLPCLMLGYMGQAAYLMDNYGDPQQAFFSSIPDGGFWAVFLIANFAALIASRTMTTATFSCIKQSSAIGCFPRLKIVHTSRKFMGQIYIPVINWFLMASAVLLVCCIASTNEIGNAYGIAEIGVMMMTTFLVTLVMLLIWQINITTVIIFSFFFLGMELLFLSSVLSGIGDGSWIILLFSIVVFLIMCIWNYGSKLKYETENERFLFRRVCSKGYHIFRCIARYGYKDVRKENHQIFEQLLIESLEKFIRREAQERQLESDGDDDDSDFENDPSRVLVGPNGSVYFGVPEGRNVINQYHPQPPPMEATTSEASGHTDPELSLENELAFLHKAKESGVVYLMGHGDIRAKKESWFIKKLVINYFYAFMRKNCRRGIATLSVPHTHLIQVAMTYMV
ncbi:unnamed protein product [Lactuca virosa]|uniref:Potassium transporter n=1 Tax=Lactuca virosa TaxID=75947 RepID=A0AAU9P4F4_9ASTR|nr:unnamed protein product [Lactuca virosa]